METFETKNCVFEKWNDFLNLYFRKVLSKLISHVNMSMDNYTVTGEKITIIIKCETDELIPGSMWKDYFIFTISDKISLFTIEFEQTAKTNSKCGIVYEHPICKRLEFENQIIDRELLNYDELFDFFSKTEINIIESHCISERNEKYNICLLLHLMEAVNEFLEFHSVYVELNILNMFDSMRRGKNKLKSSKSSKY